MKTVFPRVFLIVSSILCMNLFEAPVHANQPIQEGTYFLGSRSISIARRENRFCYLGISRNDTTVASMTPDPRRPGAYKINQFDSNIVVQQRNRKTLIFGDPQSQIEYTLDPKTNVYEFLEDSVVELKRCLSSSKPFFKKLPSRR
jgi:hypothetical protein